MPSADGRWSFKFDERAQMLRQALATTGALVCGRRLFDHTKGWEDNHPVGAPVVVVTHHPPRMRENGRPSPLPTAWKRELRRPGRLPGTRTSPSQRSRRHDSTFPRRPA